MSVGSLTGTRMAGISRGRTFRRGASIAALLVAGWCWLALAAPAEGASSGKRLVVAPREGAKLPARPLTIKVRAGRKAVLRARLNGKAIGRHFSHYVRHGVRRLHASASHGLRHRRNVLRVRVRRPGARRARVATVHFRVATNRPLAAAGFKRTVAVHARLGLDGGRSRLHPPARRRGAGLDYRWRLLRAPPASELRTNGRNPNSAAGRRVKNLGPDALFSRRGSSTPRFRADYPGLYRFRLTVTAPDGATGVDDVPVQVTSGPLVPIDTMARGTYSSQDDSWSFGVLVGQHLYPDPGNSQKWLQLVVLNPETLAPIPGPMANKAYDCPEATQNPYAERANAVNRCIQAVNSDLAQLRKDYPNKRLVVIGVSQRLNAQQGSGDGWDVQPPVGLPNALAPIGGRAIAPDQWANRDQPMLRGGMSVVGFLGSKVAEGTNHLNLDLAENRTAGVRGYLLRDNWGLYSSFASGEHVPFDTQAPGSTATHNVMRIGGRSFTADLDPYASGGFHVVILERQGLEGHSYVFDNLNEHAGIASAELKRMIDTISNPDDQRHGALVFIATVGDPHVLMF